MKRLWGCLLLIALVAVIPAQFPKVRVGSMAPPLKVAKWVKGSPIAKLGTGKVQVVEFWATWCDMCRESIPHLNEMAKRYRGKAEFVGVLVFEEQEGPKDTRYIARVQEFVRRMGSQMDYAVAVDGPDSAMADKWVSASKKGIPLAFVIGRDGRIAWIGRPMEGLDEVVAKVVSGRYDIEAEQRRRAKEDAITYAQAELMRPLNEAYGAKDWPRVVSITDGILARNPELRPTLSGLKFEALLQIDEQKAYAYARELGEGIYKDNARMLNQVAWTIVDDKTELKDPDFATAVALADRAVALTEEKDASILDTLAYALWKQGVKGRALRLQEKAVRLAQNPAYPPNSRRELEERLKMMRSGTDLP